MRDQWDIDLAGRGSAVHCSARVVEQGEGQNTGSVVEQGGDKARV